MKTRAAVLTSTSTEWEVTDLDLDPPKAGEILVKLAAAGLCHSDEHSRRRELVPRFPLVGGHEGAGVVQEVGPGVAGIAAGDHVVCSFIPSCGTCRYCSTGHHNLCDLGARLLEGCLLDGTFRFHGGGEDYGNMLMVGSFSQYTVLSEKSCIKIPDHIPLDVAALVGCGVTTGWGAAVYTAEVAPGDTVMVFGVGGIGINAVQGARAAGASHIVVVEPVEHKRGAALKLGATHAFASAAEAEQVVRELTYGVGADKSIVTVGVADSDVIRAAFDALAKRGIMVIVSLSSPGRDTIQLPSFFLVNWEKQIRGSLFGSSNPQYDIKKMLSLYDDGRLILDDLVTTRYSLDDVAQGYRDLESGRNIRGLIDYSL